MIRIMITDLVFKPSDYLSIATTFPRLLLALIFHLQSQQQ